MIYEFKEILAISGYSGLFKYISQGRNGIIVEGIEDKKRMNAYAHYKVSSLDDIAIFTDSEEVPLKKVFKIINDTLNGGQALDPKSDKSDLIDFFKKIVPNYNKEKVYVSDIKKVISWYNILQRNGMNNFEDEPIEEAPKEENKKEETPDNKAE
jgi:hypothetical protein